MLYCFYFYAENLTIEEFVQLSSFETLYRISIQNEKQKQSILKALKNTKQTKMLNKLNKKLSEAAKVPAPEQTVPSIAQQAITSENQTQKSSFHNTNAINCRSNQSTFIRN